MSTHFGGSDNDATERIAGVLKDRIAVLRDQWRGKESPARDIVDDKMRKLKVHLFRSASPIRPYASAEPVKMRFPFQSSFLDLRSIVVKVGAANNYLDEGSYAVSPDARFQPPAKYQPPARP